jgi:hypothetical protein
LIGSCNYGAIPCILRPPSPPPNAQTGRPRPGRVIRCPGARISKRITSQSNTSYSLRTRHSCSIPRAPASTSTFKRVAASRPLPRLLETKLPPLLSARSAAMSASNPQHPRAGTSTRHSLFVHLPGFHGAPSPVDLRPSHVCHTATTSAPAPDSTPCKRDSPQYTLSDPDQTQRTRTAPSRQSPPGRSSVASMMQRAGE